MNNKYTKTEIHFSAKIETEDRLSQATKERQQEIEKKVTVSCTYALEKLLYGT